MDRLVFIDATMREESRTRRIALPIISELSGRYDIETIRLDGAGFPVVDGRILHDRDCGIVPVEYADMSRRIAAADRIVIAAPFWDMSFPSALKVFFENMSLFHITFDSDDRQCYGLCRCSRVLYITTRGMDIHTGDPLEQATPYIRALSHLWGLGELYVVSAENLDYSTPEEVGRKIQAAITEGLEICRTF
ncbi:MAG: NAD(P)H-dependent oxidoreductase [Bacteroidetes bacterium]|uniref:NAD(P)H-dependent oxidoreductase n=1 Tax=Candidatus Cryptobacteroides merdigallinarum TaxID=2840770 RepID=A0A9D9HF12_9BACT|nr:NAD(P)H-dependent oxidoreductase [Candidatus Cryptobacteroides merdigallinarum]